MKLRVSILGLLLAGLALVLVKGSADAYAEEEARAERSQTALLAGCGISQAARMWVGFGSAHGIDDFEATAAQARRILATTRLQLCRGLDARGKGALRVDRSLLQAIASKVRVELTEVLFSNARLTRARARLVALGATGGADPAAPRWLAHLLRRDDDWLATHVVRE